MTSQILPSYIFYADIEENDIIVFSSKNLNFRASYLENGLANSGDAYISDAYIIL